MNRFLNASRILLLICCVPASLIADDSDGEDQPQRTDDGSPLIWNEEDVLKLSPAEAAIEKKLSKTIDVKFDGAKLSAALAYIEKQTGLKFDVEWDELEKAGVEDKPRVILQLKGVPARVALALVLDYMNADVLEPIEARVRDGRLTLTRRRRFLRTPQVLAYDLKGVASWPVDRGHAQRWRWMTGLTKNEAAALDAEAVEWSPTRDDMIGGVQMLLNDTVGQQEEWATYGGEFASVGEQWPTLFVKAARVEQRQAASRLLSRRAALNEQMARVMRDDEIALLLKKANELRIAGKKDEARKLVQKAGHVRPEHPVVLAMRRVLGDKDATRAKKVVTIGPLTRINGAPPVKASLAFETSLRRPISVEFKKTKLRDALRAVSEQLNVNIAVNWNVMEALGVEAEMPITLAAADTPGQAVLQAIAKQVGGGGPALEPIEMVVRDDIVIISSRRKLNHHRRTTTHHYDIRDLLDWPLDYLSASAFEAEPANPEDRAVGVELMTRDELVEHMTTLIQDTIGRQEEWAAYGGDVSSVRELTGILTVKTLPDHHRQIVNLLNMYHRQTLEGIVGQLVEQEIRPLLAEADKLRKKQAYDAALKLLEKALEVRPNHPRALVMRSVIRDTLRRAAEDEKE